MGGCAARAKSEPKFIAFMDFISSIHQVGVKSPVLVYMVLGSNPTTSGDITMSVFQSMI
jgi:hypothetical protein